MLGRTRSVVARALPLTQQAALRSAQPAIAAQRMLGSGSVRHMSAPAHNDDHGHGAAKDVDTRAWLFGEDPSKKRKPEAWEWIFGGGMTATMFLMYIVASNGPDTSLVRWAREEALHTGFKVPEVTPDLQDD